MTQQSDSRGDSPAPTAPGKPKDHASRQQRSPEPTAPQRPALSGEEKQAPSGPTPPGAK